MTTRSDLDDKGPPLTDQSDQQGVISPGIGTPADGTGALQAGPDGEGGVFTRADNDFPVPEVAASIDPAVLCDPERPLQVKSLPESVVAEIERQAEAHGETHRTVLLRFLMHAAALRPEFVPLRLPAGQLVDLRRRNARLRKVATDVYVRGLKP